MSAYKDGVAGSLAEMGRLLVDHPPNAGVICPYIGWSEVASSPSHAHHRHVINFGNRNEEECWRRWPDLMTIVEQRVKPERLRQKDRGAKDKWWQFIRPRPELQEAIAGLDRVLVAGSQASTHFALAFLPNGLVYSSNLSVLAIDSDAGFATLQSRVHEAWGRFFMSTLEDRLAYTPTTVFEPFPLPRGWETAPGLVRAGQAYSECRAHVMIANGEGMTKTYNRFHDPNERSPEIAKLRALHTAMDRAVLEAYGWGDISTDCEFVLDYEDDDDDGLSRRKEPWRYRWPDDVHDEVLARLIELNAERAAAEQRSGAAAEPQGRRARSGKPTVAAQAEGLF